MQLTHFSSALIGEIASYLSQSSYARFSRINKFISKACNSPNRLRNIILTQTSSSRILTIDTRNEINYSTVNLSKYHSVQHLSISLHKFNQLKLNYAVGKRLKSLLLKIDCVPSPNDIDIEAFMTQQLLKFHHLESLYLSNFGSLRTNFNRNTFCRILSKFPMIKYLNLKMVRLNEPIDNEVLQSLLPNLKQLTLSRTNLTKNMIHAFGQQLQLLHFQQYETEIFELSNDSVFHLNSDINFKNLTNLSLKNPSNLSIDTILKTAKSLRSIEFEPKAVLSFFEDHNMNNDEITETMTRLIIEQPLLENITLNAYHNSMEPICKGIEIGLFKTKMFYRKQIKFVFWSRPKNLNPKNVMMYISRFIHCLLLSKVNTFMIMLKWLTCKYQWNTSDDVDVDKQMIKYAEELMSLIPQIQMNHQMNQDDAFCDHSLEIVKNSSD